MTTLNADQIKLQAHLDKMAEDDKLSGSSMSLTTELEHWAGYDIHTVEQLNHYLAQSCHYDFYKEIHGIRPRWYDYSKMTAEQIEGEIDLLVKEQEYQIEQEKEWKDEQSRIIQKRKKDNAYKPNNVFSELAVLFSKAA